MAYRIDQHLNKNFPFSFTAKTDDWMLFLLIDNLGYQQARNIEINIKMMKSKKFIENLKQFPEIIKRLTLKYE